MRKQLIPFAQVIKFL